MIFINLKKAYDRIPGEVIWHFPENKHVHRGYIDTIKNMCDRE